MWYVVKKWQRDGRLDDRSEVDRWLKNFFKNFSKSPCNLGKDAL